MSLIINTIGLSIYTSNGCNFNTGKPMKMNVFSKAIVCLLITLFTLGVFSTKVHGQNFVSANANLLYNLASNYQFIAADSLIAANPTSAKYDPGFQLATMNFYWWKLISGNENEGYAQKIDSLLQQMTLKVKPLENNLENNQRFMMICAYAYNTRIDLKNNSYLEAFTKLRRYHALIKPSFGQEEKYPAYYLTSGLYHFFTAYAKINIPIIGLLIGRYAEKDKETGWKYLKTAASSPDDIVRNEACYFLMRIELDLNNNYPEAAKHCDKLLAENPNNLRFHYYRVQINLALHQTERAKKMIEKMKIIADQNPNLTPKERVYFVKMAKEMLLKADKK